MSAKTEFWATEKLRRWADSFQRFITQHDYESPYRVEVEDTGSANSLNTIRHELGYVPTGLKVINCSVPANGAPTWFRLDTDDDWTATTITLRFDVANARVLLEIF